VHRNQLHHEPSNASFKKSQITVFRCFRDSVLPKEGSVSAFEIKRSKFGYQQYQQIPVVA
jgi:hypothetical protein